VPPDDGQVAVGEGLGGSTPEMSAPVWPEAGRAVAVEVVGFDEMVEVMVVSPFCAAASAALKSL